MGIALNLFFFFDIFYIYISKVIPFSGPLTSAQNTPIPEYLPMFLEGVPSPISLPPPTFDSPTLGHLSSLHRTKDPLMPDQAILVLNAYRYNLLNGRISPLFRKLSNEIDLQADILSAAYSRMIILLIIYIYIYIYI